MADGLERYASPGLRWGLAVDDFEGITAEFSVMTAERLGLPRRVADPDVEFVVATIVFPPGTGRAPVRGWKLYSNRVKGKVINVDHESDLWEVLCTKALGRALKRAGYPANLDDLRALVVWRRRNVELEALRTGHATLALRDSAADMDRALAAAGSTDPERVDGDDTGAAPPEAVEGEIVDTDVVDENLTGPPSDETLAAMREAISALDSDASKGLTRWCREQGWRVSRPETEQQARAITLEALGCPHGAPASAADGVEPAGLAADCMAVIAGLDDGERKAFGAHLAALGIDTVAFAAAVEAGEVPPLEDGEWHEVAAWLEVG